MPRSQTIVEAILRGLGGAAQQVGGQIQAGRTADIEAERRRREVEQRVGVTQRGFEALQLQRSIQNKLAQSRDLRAQHEFEIEHPMGPPEPEPPERFKTVGALEASLAQQAFDESGLEGFLDLKRRFSEAGRAQTKEGVPFTPAQKTPLINQIVKKNVAQTVGQFPGATSISDLRNIGKGTEETPGDTLAQRLFEETEYLGSPEYRLAASRLDTLGKYFPERVPQPEPQREALRGIEANIAGFLGSQGPTVGAQQQDPDSIGRATYNDWDQMTEAQRAELIRLGFPTE